MGNIIGRKQEIRELNDLYNSDKAQMVAGAIYLKFHSKIALK